VLSSARYEWTYNALTADNGADLNKRNNGRSTALSLAAHSGSKSFVELLLIRGASLDCQPHGSSLDSYLDWLAVFYPERMRNIRKLFDAARTDRAYVDGTCFWHLSV
jgi:ankyrin repeat protein